MRIYILMGGCLDDDWNFYGAFKHRKDAEAEMAKLLRTTYGVMAEITDTILQ